MKFFLTCDANWESKISHALRSLDSGREFFAGCCYGEDLQDIGIVLMCRDPELAFVQRNRYYKDRAALSMDVMFDLPMFIAATHAQRRLWVHDAVLAEVLRIIAKKKLKDFDLPAFEADLRAYLSQLLSEDAARFDALVLERATGY